MWLLDKMLSRVVNTGQLIVTDHDGKQYSYGPGSDHPIRIRLTDKGRMLAKTTNVEPMEIFREVLATLSRDDTRDLMRILSKLQKRVRAYVKDRAAEMGGTS